MTEIAVGGPNLVSGDGWDVAPLLLASVLLLLALGAGGRCRASTVIVAIGGGIGIDLASDAFALEPVILVAPIVVAMAFVALRGTVVP